MGEAPSQADWQEAAATKTLTLEEMNNLLIENQAIWDEHDVVNKEKQRLYALGELSDSKIMEALKSAGKSSYKVDGVGTASLSTKAVVSCPKTIAEKKVFFTYLKKLGEEVLYSLTTVNSQSLNSWYNEKFDEAVLTAQKAGSAIAFSIPGIAAPTTRETLSFRKDKKGLKNDTSTTNPS